MNSSDNIKDLCRLCGSKTISHNRINIFDSDDSSNINIDTKITNCIGIIVRENDDLPNVLCTDCVDNVEKFNRFKIDSLRTTEMLLELFIKSTSSSSKSNKVLPERLNILEPEIQIETDDSKLNLVPVKRKSSIKTKKVIAKRKKKEDTIETEYPCNYCSAHFTSYIESIKHVKLVHKKASENRNSLSSKNVKNTEVVKVKKERGKYKKSDNKLKCHFCEKEYRHKCYLISHIQTHIYEPLPCSYCNKIFKRYNDLKYHIKRHEKAYDHICYYCGKGFIGKTAFEIHVRTKHTKEYPYECEKCEKKFASKFGLKNHDLIVHTNNNTFICEICGKSFKNPYYLKQHKRSHEIPMEERKKFKCTICEAAFINRKGVKRHMLVHTGELPYECKLCEKRYKDKRGLKTHSLVHSGERNFVCNVCGKAFALKFNLDVHQKIHTGERPYQCNVCLKTFTQNSSLNLHRKKSCHGIQQQVPPIMQQISPPALL